MKYMRYIPNGSVVAFNPLLLENSAYESFDVADGVNPHVPAEAEKPQVAPKRTIKLADPVPQ